MRKKIQIPIVLSLLFIHFISIGQISDPKNIHLGNNRKQSGYSNITELNLGLGKSTDNLSLGIQTVNGYQFNPNFSLGFGIGLDMYKNFSYLPLFLDTRFNFLKSSVSPFFAANAGYSLGFGIFKGGIMLNPSLGLKIFISPKIALNFSVGYRYQENKINYKYISVTNSDNTNPTIKNTSLLSLKFGFAF